MVTPVQLFESGPRGPPETSDGPLAACKTEHTQRTAYMDDVAGQADACMMVNTPNALDVVHTTKTWHAEHSIKTGASRPMFRDVAPVDLGE